MENDLPSRRAARDMSQGDLAEAVVRQGGQVVAGIQGRREEGGDVEHRQVAIIGTASHSTVVSAGAGLSNTGATVSTICIRWLINCVLPQPSSAVHIRMIVNSWGQAPAVVSAI